MNSYLDDIKRAEFLKALGPLMEWMNNNPELFDPYTKVVVDLNEAHIHSHLFSIKDDTYLKD